MTLTLLKKFKIKIQKREIGFVVEEVDTVLSKALVLHALYLSYKTRTVFRNAIVLVWAAECID